MGTPHHQTGFTLLETILTVALTSFVVIGGGVLFKNASSMLKRVSVRQQVALESRICMDTITQRMRGGKARSLMISTPAASPLVPYSRVDFVLQNPLASGATVYAFYLAGGTVYSQEIVYPPQAARTPQPLASHVSGLMFSGDSHDPALVGVSLRIDAPWDTTNDPSHVVSVTVANQMVHMLESQ